MTEPGEERRCWRCRSADTLELSEGITINGQRRMVCQRCVEAQVTALAARRSTSRVLTRRHDMIDERRQHARQQRQARRQRRRSPGATPTLPAVPDLAGMTEAEATAALTAANFQAGDVTVTVVTDPDTLGVQSQTLAAGTRAAAGTAVGFTVHVLEVPDLAGMTETEATAALTAAGLTAGDVSEAPNDDPAQDGLVQSQTLAAGTRLDAAASVGFAVGFVPFFAATITWGFEDPSDTTGEDSGWESDWLSTGFGSIEVTYGGSIGLDGNVDVDDPAFELRYVHRRTGTSPAIHGDVTAWTNTVDLRGTWVKLVLPDGTVYGKNSDFVPSTLHSWNTNSTTDPEAASMAEFTDDLVPAAGTEVPVTLWSQNPNPQ